MRIVDGHVHIFSRVNGRNANGPVVGTSYGKTLNAGVESSFMPPYYEKTCFPVDVLMETLRQNGVEKAVLLQNPTIGSVNDEIGQAMRAHPKMLAGTLQVDPFAMDATAQMEAWLSLYPFAALKLELSTGWGWSGIHRAEKFSYRQLGELLEAASARRLTVIVDTGDTASYAYKPESMKELIGMFPDVAFVIEHGGYYTPGCDEESWQAMVALGRLENVYMGICAMGVLLEDPYPCEKADMLLRRIKNVIGAEKLIWGTDIPSTLKLYTYRQMLDAVFLSDALSSAEKEKTFFKNAERLYFP